MAINSNKSENWWKPALDLFAKISGWIVIPILIGLYLGKWLDNKYDKSPTFLLICVGVAFIITNVGLVLNVLQAARQMEKEANKKKEEKIKI